MPSKQKQNSKLKEIKAKLVLFVYGSKDIHRRLASGWLARPGGPW